jgi:hypothetical protein
VFAWLGYVESVTNAGGGTMRETKQIGTRGLFYTGTVDGLVKWARDLMKEHGQRATIKQVCEAQSKDEEGGKSSGA